jgi:hypothetical protein
LLCFVLSVWLLAIFGLPGYLKWPIKSFDCFILSVGLHISRPMESRCLKTITFVLETKVLSNNFKKNHGTS